MEQKNILQKLAHSRRIWVFAFSVIVTFVMIKDPSLVQYKDQINLFIGLAISLILGLSLEDSVKAWAARPGTFQESIKDLVVEIVDELFTEKTGNETDGQG
jgi:low affinity Fe/Cu permease